MTNSGGFPGGGAAALDEGGIDPSLRVLQPGQALERAAGGDELELDAFPLEDGAVALSEVVLSTLGGASGQANAPLGWVE